MNKLTLWIISALAGMIFLFFLNASPLSRFGFNVELPFGWQLAKPMHVCTEQEQAELNTNSCAPATCTLGTRHNEGIPFAVNRVSKTTSCGQDSNNLAMLSNT